MVRSFKISIHLGQVLGNWERKGERGGNPLGDMCLSKNNFKLYSFFKHKSKRVKPLDLRKVNVKIGICRCIFVKNVTINDSFNFFSKVGRL